MCLGVHSNLHFFQKPPTNCEAMSSRKFALINFRLRRGSTIPSASIRSLSNSLPRRAALDVGEIEGVEFKVEPLRRTGEDRNTMRARLLCLSTLHFHWSSDFANSPVAIGRPEPQKRNS